MSQDNLVKLKCTNCGRINYHSTRNKRKIQKKLEINKYCKWCRKHYPHKEIK